MKTKILLAFCLLLCMLRAHAQATDTTPAQTTDASPAQSSDTPPAQAADDESTHAGYVPVATGTIAYVYNVQGGIPTLEPQIEPLLLVPLGSHLLFENRTEFEGSFEHRNGTSGDYTGRVFKNVDYVQLDWLANTHVIPVLGKYILPFGLYAERLDPLWVENIQDFPIDFGIGTRPYGAGVGPQLRGVAMETPKFNVQYSAYYSVHDNVTQLQSARTAGGDASIYFPGARAEIGSSYQRFLDNRQINNEAVYATWQPIPSDLDLKFQYSRSYFGHGYWIEGYDMFTWAPVANNFFRRMQAVLRGEVSYPLHGGGTGVPTVEVKRAETALNYYIGNDWRLLSSYGRQSDAGRQFNIWNLGFTYRFVWPLGREKK